VPTARFQLPSVSRESASAEIHAASPLGSKILTRETDLPELDERSRKVSAGRFGCNVANDR